MKCSFGISNFLKEISSLSHCIVFLYFFALITKEGFLISPCSCLELWVFLWENKITYFPQVLLHPLRTDVYFARIPFSCVFTPALLRSLCCAGPPSVSVRILVRLSTPGQPPAVWSSLPTNHGVLCFLLHPIPKDNTSGVSRTCHACPSPSQYPLHPSSSISLTSLLLIQKLSPCCREAVHPTPHALSFSHCSSFLVTCEGQWARTCAPFLISSSPYISPGQCGQLCSFHASEGSKQTPSSDQMAAPGPASLDALKLLTSYVCTPNQVSASSQTPYIQWH